MNYISAVFLFAWLGGWYFGFESAVGELRAGTGDKGFLMFWLVGWSCGGLFAVWMLYQLLRPTVAESITLRGGQAHYDSGVSQLAIPFGFTASTKIWRSAFPKRRRCVMSSDDLRSLMLRETDSGNRLTIDVGSDRIDLAEECTEVEREWLYGFLSQRSS